MPRKLVRRYKGRKKKNSGGTERSSPRSNPPLMTDIAEFIGPGFAGFAAARFATYLATTQIAKRKPTWGKHAGGATAIGVFVAAWLLANKWKWLAKYQMPLVVGAGIAAIQSLLQLYIPKIGWMVSDASPELATTAAQQQIAAGTGIPADMTATNEDPNLYTYNDSYDAGRMSTTSNGPQAGQAADDNLDDLNLDDTVGQTQQMGSLGG